LPLVLRRGIAFGQKCIMQDNSHELVFESFVVHLTM